MYTEVTSTGDLRNNPLAMSLHPVRIGPNYVIRSDDRNTCSFFPDSLKVKYSNNVASTETTYKTLKSYQQIHHKEQEHIKKKHMRNHMKMQKIHLLMIQNVEDFVQFIHVHFVIQEMGIQIVKKEIIL